MAKKKQEMMDLREFKLDPWQRRVLRHKGSIVLRTGRQVGKSTVVAIKSYNLAMQFPGTNTLVVAAAQRQSSLLFEKIRAMFDMDNYKKIREATDGIRFDNATDKRTAEKEASIYEEEPTQTRIVLKNGSNVFCHPTGRTGAFIRGFTVDFLIADEAAFIDENVWVAIVPMLATSKKARGTGWLILLSTPKGKRGYFYEAFRDKGFLAIHVSSEKCKRIGKKFLSAQKRKLTKVQYAQEYLGEFVEGYNQFFPTVAIDKAAILQSWQFERDYNPRLKYYLGVDIARYGGDENTFYVVEMDDNGQLKGIFNQKTSRVATTETTGRIKALDDKFHFRKIFIDGSGVGGGVVDMLMESFGNRVLEINNAARAINPDLDRKKILKEDLYSNALVLMEQGKIQFIRDPQVISSLKSITFEYTDQGFLRIYGKGSHLAEAFVRACWSVKNKGLDLFLM